MAASSRRPRRARRLPSRRRTRRRDARPASIPSPVRLPRRARSASRPRRRRRSACPRRRPACDRGSRGRSRIRAFREGNGSSPASGPPARVPAGRGYRRTPRRPGPWSAMASARCQSFDLRIRLLEKGLVTAGDRLRHGISGSFDGVNLGRSAGEVNGRRRGAGVLGQRLCGTRLFLPGLVRLLGRRRAEFGRPTQPQPAHERLSPALDGADGRAGQPHRRHDDHGLASERHCVLRLDLPDRDRRRACAPAIDRYHAHPLRRPAVRPRHHAARLGGEGDRARGDLRLRLLQVLLGLSPVQLRRDSHRRRSDPARRTRTRNAPSPQPGARRR